MLDAGLLRTGNDFYAAAMIFQHGGDAEHYLVAHALAVRALALGVAKAEWLAAASLDRYLHAIARDQIYGTQYEFDPITKKAHQGRYDPTLLPDQIRVGAGVEPLAGQEAKRQQMEKRNAGN